MYEIALAAGSETHPFEGLNPAQSIFSFCACRLVDEIVWVKMTVNRRLAKSHGYYLQHAKEVCLVGKKGPDPPRMQVRNWAGVNRITHILCPVLRN